ncbi:hypothetical protein FRC08_000107 [Ceratobasidium sp. 394]|nr:hypothetical protein FRC08_000107 [Ceratobasidium sp. 394]KAG9085471.1 hypothetical protein FS749_004390 [Ceratobasidium sp. UAMH 11750]
MEAESSSANTMSRTPIPEATKTVIREAVRKKGSRNGTMLLNSLLKSLADSGYEPPDLSTIVDHLDGDFSPLGLDEVVRGTRDMFEVLEHPIFGDMFTAALRKIQAQDQPPFDFGGNQLEATIKAWGVPFVGPAAELLKQAMDQMNTKRRDANYANFLPIVQSSGMGKSRTVDELARRVFTLPFNLRPTAEHTGYPRGDPDVLKGLSAWRRTARQLRSRHCIFFEQLFKAVYKVLQSFPTFGSQEELAEHFRTWLETNKETLYRRVCEECERQETNPTRFPDADQPPTIRAEDSTTAASTRIKLLESQNQGESNEPEALRSASTANELSQGSTSNRSDSVDSPEWQAAQALVGLIRQKSSVQSSGELALRTNKEPGTPRPVWLHIYFDESHPLTSDTTEPEDGQMYTSYQVLCSVINRFRTLDLFVVFLSTNSSISVYSESPPQSLFWSGRVINHKTSGVQAPFCELVFDQWGRSQHLLFENVHTLQEVCKPKFMVRFGRPLFWTRYESGDSEIKGTIVSFARAKLAGTQDGTLNDNGQLAVLGIRIGLSFDRSRVEARLKEERLIEGYMRVAFSVPEHREYIYADALSEPILAEAGAQLMHMNEMWDGFPRVLFDWCNRGLIDKGERGELLVRLLLTKAHDYIIRLISPELRPPPGFTRPILLSDFLEALVGKENRGRIFSARPNNVPDGLTLAESALGQARLNFTHWAKAGDDSVVTDEATWIALGRCLAWQCFDNQSEIDLITPLMLPPGEDAKLGRYTVSAVFWQIKNRIKTPPVDIDAERLGFFSPYSASQKTPSSVTAEYANSRPYLTVVLNLGVQVTEPDTAKPETVKLAAANSRSNNPYTADSQAVRNKTNFPSTISPAAKRRSNRKSKLVHPRYSISISGCSHKTFPSLVSASEDHQYASLLTPGDFAAEHVRKDQVFKEAIVGMKPVWKKAEGRMGSYYQVKREEPTCLGHAPPQDQSSEVVEIHEYASDAESGEAAEDEPEDGMEIGHDQAVGE